MSTNLFRRMRVGRLFVAGAIFCTLVVPGLSVRALRAHGDEISEASLASRSNLSSPEGAGLQAASWALSVPYGAAKMSYAIGGGFVGALAWAMTGGDLEVAKSIWIPSMTGDYIVQPPHLTGEMHLYFVGMPSTGSPY
ncbi:MAG: hypothetical protein MRJ66_00240 [Nitrospira sp.]|nr:hypothetical protein [Nitrospira sp.]